MQSNTSRLLPVEACSVQVWCSASILGTQNILMRSTRFVRVRQSKWTRTSRFSFQLGILFVILFCAAFPQLLHAGTEEDAWLRSSRLDSSSAKSYESLPANTVLLGDSAVLKTAQQELLRGVAQMLGRPLHLSNDVRAGGSIVLGTLAGLHTLAPSLNPPQDLKADGYWLKQTKIHGSECLLITAANDRGVLYG